MSTLSTDKQPEPARVVGSTALLGSVHFSSATDEWATPRAYFDTVSGEFGPFDLDPCATPESAKAPKFFTKADDGLAQEWTGRVWMNPPYGRVIGAWMRKAYETAQAGHLVVCLVPARTDTAWWHDYAAKGTVRFIRGRLKFGDAKNSAPFPSALVVFGMPNEKVSHAMSQQQPMKNTSDTFPRYSAMDGSVNLTVKYGCITAKCPRCGFLMDSQNPPIEAEHINPFRLPESKLVFLILDSRPKCPECRVRFNVTAQYRSPTL